MLDGKLLNLINTYLLAVSEAVELIKRSGIAMPPSDFEWAMNGIPNRGVLCGSVPYRKHGYGCEVELPSDSVDFDFGAHGEITGFDVWRLATFAEAKLHQYGISSVEELEVLFKSSVQRGYLLPRGNLYFLQQDVR